MIGETLLTYRSLFYVSGMPYPYLVLPSLCLVKLFLYKKNGVEILNFDSLNALTDLCSWWVHCLEMGVGKVARKEGKREKALVC